MPQAMRRFRDRWPDVRVRILEGVRDHLIALVRDGTLDFAAEIWMPSLLLSWKMYFPQYGVLRGNPSSHSLRPRVYR